MAGSILLLDTDVDFLRGYSKAVAFVNDRSARIILSSIAETRQLAEYGGKRIECADRAVPEPEDWRDGDCLRRSRGLVESPEHEERHDQLAIYDQGCTDQTEKALPHSARVT